MRTEGEIRKMLKKLDDGTPFQYGAHLALKWVLEELSDNGLIL